MINLCYVLPLSSSSACVKLELVSGLFLWAYSLTKPLLICTGQEAHGQWGNVAGFQCVDLAVTPLVKQLQKSSTSESGSVFRAVQENNRVC